VRGRKDAEDIDHFTNSINDSEFSFEISEVHKLPAERTLMSAFSTTDYWVQGCFKLLPIVLLVDTESKE
jgi:hypothetical protein